MRVKQLKITAFRGIRDLTLTFDDDNLAVFIGVNGVGKSSILECIKILLSWFLARIQHDPDRQSISTTLGDRRNRSEGLYFDPEDNHNESQKARGEIVFLTGLDNDDITWTLEQGYKPQTTRRRSRLEQQKDTRNQLEKTADDFREKWEENDRADLPLAVYYPVNRGVLDIPLEIQDNYRASQVDAYEQALTGVKISFDSFFKWFRALEDIENEARRDDIEYRDRQLESVRKVIYSILGDEFKELRVRRQPQLRMTIRKNDTELIVDRLSDGEKSLLAMAGDLARRLAISQPSLPEPLKGSALVLIDEIEQHLHPGWQRKIIPILTETFPNCQFIITTHSPQVVSQVKPESIYILKKVGDDTIVQHPESSFGRDSNRILEDLMGVPARPSAIKDKLLHLFRLIDDGNLEQAKAMQREIATEIGEDEPELVRASVSIRRREILKR